MGNLTSQTDANGQVTTLFYDGLNRLVGKSFSNGDTPITYTYDENGHTGYRTSMTDASGETHWQYDTRGRVVEEAKTILNQGTYTTQWAYDSQNRVKHMFYPNGERVKFSYNTQGEVKGLENNHTKILTNRIMDNHGRIKEQIYGNGTSTAYSYDQWLSGAGRLMTLNTKKRNDEFLQELSYSYDPIGNLTQLNNMSETLNFSYDALSRLTGVSGAYEESYTYNSRTGNLTSKTGVDGDYHYDASKPHAVTGYDSEPNAFEYDANGQMVKRHGKDIGYDAQGKLISYDGKSHVYDGDGNRVMMDHGDGKVTVYIGNYYERLMDRMDDVGPVDPPVTRNGGQEYASYFPVVGNGETVDYETHRGQTYYYAGSSRIAMRTIDGEVIWLYGDHLGSTSVTADRHGNELSRTKYHAWGTTRYSSGDQHTDYAYTGQMQVDDIYYYNARWYDPAIGRFMQADTLVPGHQGTQAFDRYAYVNNNPMRYLDLTGNYACDANGDCFIAGWSLDYARVQEGNSCAVNSVAMAVSVLKGQNITQEGIIDYFPITKHLDLGAPAFIQSTVGNLFDINVSATKARLDKEGIIQQLEIDRPVVVTFALPLAKDMDGNRWAGHSILAIGYRESTNEIIFLNPASGKVEYENSLVQKYGSDVKKNFNEAVSSRYSFNDFGSLQSNSNVFVPAYTTVVFFHSIFHHSPVPMYGNRGENLREVK